MSIASGTRFGSYEVFEQIGSGGMGEVYRATDANMTSDNRYAAVDVDTADFSTRNRVAIQIGGTTLQARLHDSMPEGSEMLVPLLGASPSLRSTDTETLVIVENWIEESKRRVPID